MVIIAAPADAGFFDVAPRSLDGRTSETNEFSEVLSGAVRRSSSHKRPHAGNEKADHLRTAATESPEADVDAESSSETDEVSPSAETPQTSREKPEASDDSNPSQDEVTSQGDGTDATRVVEKPTAETGVSSVEQTPSADATTTDSAETTQHSSQIAGVVGQSTSHREERITPKSDDPISATVKETTDIQAKNRGKRGQSAQQTANEKPETAAVAEITAVEVAHLPANDTDQTAPQPRSKKGGSGNIRQISISATEELQHAPSTNQSRLGQQLIPQSPASPVATPDTPISLGVAAPQTLNQATSEQSRQATNVQRQTPTLLVEALEKPLAETEVGRTELSPKTTVPPRSAVFRVARAIQQLRETGGVIRLRLAPPELGAMKVQVSVSPTGVAAQLEAETPEAQSLLAESLPILRDRLSAQEIKIERLEVDLMQQRDDQSAQNERGAFAERDPSPHARAARRDSQDDGEELRRLPRRDSVGRFDALA